MKKRFLVLAMALCMVFALGFAFAETTDKDDLAKKQYHDTICVEENGLGDEDWVECSNPEHNIPVTCTTDGTKCFVCPDCMYCVKKVTVKATGHIDWAVGKEALAPTCNTLGHEAYTWCKGCVVDGKPTTWGQRDDKGEVKIIDGKPNIAKLNHKKEDGELFAVPPSTWEPEKLECETQVSLQAVCGYCGEELRAVIDIEIKHEWEEVEEVPAVCETDGVKAHSVCTREHITEDGTAVKCGKILFNGKVYKSADAATVLKIEKLNHKENGKDAFVFVHGTAGSCEGEGYTDHHACKLCGKVADDWKPLGAVGHDWKLIQAYKAPDCLNKGAKAVWQCQREACGAKAYLMFDADGEPVYTEKGWQAYTPYDGNDVIKELGHSYVGIPGVPATCTTPGKALYGECVRCDAKTATGEDIIIPAHGHVNEAGYWPGAKPGDENYERTIEETEAAGLKLVVQSALKSYDKIALKDREPADKPATCTTDGYKGHLYCPWCEEVIVENGVIEKLDHDWYLDESEEFAAEEPTCEGWGVSDHWLCKRCDAEDGFEPIKPLGHAWVNIPGKDATCANGGWYEFDYCARCFDAVITAVDNEMMVAEEEAAAVKVTFDKDGKLIIPDPFKIAKYNHGFALDVDTEEEYKTAVSTSTKLIYIEKVPATCTVNGVEGDGIWCELCEEYVVVPTVIPAPGHTWGEVEPYQAPTCQTEGQKKHQVCTVEKCAATRLLDEDGRQVDVNGKRSDVTYAGKVNEDGTKTPAEEVKIPTLVHVPEAGKAKAPTCTETGLTEGSYCKLCGMTLVEQEEIAALGHTWTTIDRVAPKCIETGYEAYRFCTVCNAAEVFQIVNDKVVVIKEFAYVVKDGKPVLPVEGIIPAAGHTFDESEECIYPAKAPTCTEAGNEKGIRCCVCKPIYAGESNVKDHEGWLIYPKTIKALGHDLVYFKGVEATCDPAVKECYYSFAVCVRDNCFHGEIAEDDMGMMIDFPTTFTVSFVFNEDGSIKYVNGLPVLAEIPAEVKVPKLEHDPAEYADRAPTCTEDGILTDTLCKRCGVKIPGEVRPAKGHKWEVLPKVEPGCETLGKIEGVKCTVCGKIFELTDVEEDIVYSDSEGDYKEVTEDTRTTIPATDHNMVHIDRKEATCMEDGYEDGEICANGCGKKNGAETIKAPMKHNVEGVKWVVVKEPTTGVDGEGIRVKYCKVCNEVGAEELIPATQEGQPGDANMDGNVNLFDVVRIMNYLLENTNEIGVGADYDGDGDIDYIDAIRLMNYLLG